jgi:hypothetical protein
MEEMRRQQRHPNIINLQALMRYTQNYGGVEEQTM